MSFKKSLIAGVALLGMPSLALAQDAVGTVTTELTVTPPSNGCTVEDLTIDIGITMSMDNGIFLTSPDTPFKVHCFGATTPASIALVLGGSATATHAALAGPSGSLIPYAIVALDSNMQAKGGVGVSTGNLLSGMSVTANPADGSGAAKLYEQDLRVNVFGDSSEALLLAPGTYTANSTIEVTY